jgi:hypothetical protein
MVMSILVPMGRPVPLLTGLVVKKGLKIRVKASGTTPHIGTDSGSSSLGAETRFRVSTMLALCQAQSMIPT